MKKYVLLSAMMLAVMVPGLAWSQTAAAPAASASAAKGGDFNEHKQKVISHINDHIAQWQKRLACAQDATTPDALKACKPARKHTDE